MHKTAHMQTVKLDTDREIINKDPQVLLENVKAKMRMMRAENRMISVIMLRTKRKTNRKV